MKSLARNSNKDTRNAHGNSARSESCHLDDRGGNGRIIL